jgi:hypothetical protein
VLNEAERKTLEKPLTTKTRNWLAFGLARDESTKEEGVIKKDRTFFVLSKFRAFVMSLEKALLPHATWNDLPATGNLPLASDK